MAYASVARVNKATMPPRCQSMVAEHWPPSVALTRCWAMSYRSSDASARVCESACGGPGIRDTAGPIPLSSTVPTFPHGGTWVNGGEDLKSREQVGAGDLSPDLRALLAGGFEGISR